MSKSRNNPATPMPARSSKPSSAAQPVVVAASASAQPDISDIKEDTYNEFLNSLYIANQVNDDDLKTIYDAVSYKGFDRKTVIKQLMVTVKDTRIITEMILAVALQGPVKATDVKLSNGKLPSDYGIPSSGGRRSKVLTLSRILAATADLAAFYLKRLNQKEKVPKRINSDLPVWLQFPSAGAIIMPANYRELHKEFSRKFSELIDGEFNEQIYNSMEANAYLTESLKLFDNP